MIESAELSGVPVSEPLKKLAEDRRQYEERVDQALRTAVSALVANGPQQAGDPSTALVGIKRRTPGQEVDYLTNDGQPAIEVKYRQRGRPPGIGVFDGPYRSMIERAAADGAGALLVITNSRISWDGTAVVTVSGRQINAQIIQWTSEVDAKVLEEAIRTLSSLRR